MKNLEVPERTATVIAAGLTVAVVALIGASCDRHSVDAEREVRMRAIERDYYGAGPWRRGLDGEPNPSKK